MLERECPNCLSNSVAISLLGDLLVCKKCEARFSLAPRLGHVARIVGTMTAVTFLLTGIFLGIKAFIAVSILGCVAAFIYEKKGTLKQVSIVDSTHS